LSISIRRVLKRSLPRQLTRVLDGVNQREPELARLSDDELGLRDVRDLVPRLALAREAAVRTLGERPHDTQVIGAAAMATGRIIEMLTGEGKTLAAALAAYAMAPGGSVHIATANDYLAARDAAWMRPLYELLGVSVAVTAPSMSRVDKQAAYACDVTYGTAREFAFDYLRDTLTARTTNRVQRGHHAALVDEIDFVLLDEARVPFVITRTAPIDAVGLAEAAQIVSALDAAVDFNVDDAQRTAWLTEAGIDTVESVIGSGAMSDPASAAGANVNMALRARCAVRRDRDYVVVGDRVHIVDESTGRILPGRRWTDGLHQAVEAKEGVPIRDDSRPLAQITVRSYIEHYATVVGMSGTALAASREFAETYGVDVVAIPPHRPVAREDLPDRVFATAEEKYDAVVDEVVSRHAKGQPLLIGTTTVAHSEYLSARLRLHDIDHRVLNAKHHAIEAAIIAEAGRVGAVTVATNMAGRGVDIKLGGSDPNARGNHDAVVKMGGLCVIGTERHSSRRVDDQLRGRAGRQGDQGESIFFASLKDDLVITQGPGQPGAIPAGLPGPHRSVEVAQRNAEVRDLALRVASHEYDEIIDRHYAGVCRFRQEVVAAPRFAEWSSALLDRHLTEGSSLVVDGRDTVRERWDSQRRRAGLHWEDLQRLVMFAITEEGWTRVLETMHHLRNWVNLVALGGTFPITEWRRRSDTAVASMRRDVESDYLHRLLAIDIVYGRKPLPAVVDPVVETPLRGELVAPRLPVAAIHPPEDSTRLILDWVEGFTGPEFHEVVVVVDPSGAESPDLALSDDGMTAYIDPSAG
jgi:preprotein translocase subunit SecA